MRNRVKIRPSMISRFAILLTTSLGMLFVQASALAIARGYDTDDTGLQTGMVVALSTGDTENKVERATNENRDRIVGIVTTFNDSLVTVTSGESEVLVETEGDVDAYVTDTNGEVKKGDLLKLSDYKGILGRASQGDGHIIGIAASDFITSNPETYSVKDGSSNKDIKIAKIKVNLNRQGANGGVVITDSALAKLGKSIVGKDVGEIRVILAVIIFFIVLIAEGGILYGAISSSITALGRNPLAGKIIRKELIRVVVIALIVLTVGLGATYGILWA